MDSVKVLNLKRKSQELILNFHLKTKQTLNSKTHKLRVVHKGHLQRGGSMARCGQLRTKGEGGGKGPCGTVFQVI